jgi:cell division protein FtsZ
MESILGDAFNFLEKEKHQKGGSEEFGHPRILIVGTGGAGNNTINRLTNMGLDGAETIAINTDRQHLAVIDADKKILIGRKLTKGLGAGGNPEVGRKAAEIGRGTLEDMLASSDMVFITAGMGGGTGTGVAPIVAEIAKDQGAIVVGMISTPFYVERGRVLVAEAGVESLRSVVDTLIVFDNNRLLDFAPNMPIEHAFSIMDQLIAEIIKGITETITQPSLINLDYADVKTIMSSGGVSFMAVGESRSHDRVEGVVRSTLSNPLLDVDYRGATGCLVHITGGPDLKLKEAAEISVALTKELDAQANVIWGARVRKDFDGKVRVMAIITGVRSPQVLGPREEDKAEISNIDVIR